MARKTKQTFPLDREEEMLTLIEIMGDRVKDLEWVSDLFEASRYSIINFLKTTKAVIALKVHQSKKHRLAF